MRLKAVDMTVDLLDFKTPVKEPIFKDKKPFHKYTVYPSKEGKIKAPSYHVLFYLYDLYDEKNEKNFKRCYAYALDFGIISYSDLDSIQDDKQMAEAKKKAIVKAYEILDEMVIHLIVDYLINDNIDKLFVNSVPHEQNEWRDYGELSQKYKIEELNKSYLEFMDQHSEVLAHEQINEGIGTIDQSRPERFDKTLVESHKHEKDKKNLAYYLKQNIIYSIQPLDNPSNKLLNIR